MHPVQYDQLHNPQPPPLTHDKQHAKIKRRAKVGKQPSAFHRKMNKVRPRLPCPALRFSGPVVFHPIEQPLTLADVTFVLRSNTSR